MELKNLLFVKSRMKFQAQCVFIKPACKWSVQVYKQLININKSYWVVYVCNNSSLNMINQGQRFHFNIGGKQTESIICCILVNSMHQFLPFLHQFIVYMSFIFNRSPLWPLCSYMVVVRGYRWGLVPCNPPKSTSMWLIQLLTYPSFINCLHTSYGCIIK